jgi:hypothetical protein
MVGTLALLGAAACAAPGPPETDRRPAEAPPAVAPVQPTAPAAQAGGAAGQAAPGQARPADRAAPASIEARKGIYAAWSPDRIAELRRAEGLVGPGPQGRPPEPSFPSYLRKPQSVEELMPAARAAVTQTGGRVPLGLVRAGEIVVIAVEWRADPMVQEAIVRAFRERNVEARVLYDNDLAGVKREDVEAIKKAESVFTAGDGQQEVSLFYMYITGEVPDPEVIKQWIRERSPELYQATWPEITYPEPRLAQISKDYNTNIADGLVRYLDEHPEVNRVFWRGGGRPNTQRQMRHHGNKFVGNYTYNDYFDIMSKVPDFPSDVWRMIEMKTVEPLGQVERAEVSDPEGSAFGFDLSAAEAETWAKAAYLQGHLYMVPAQASGHFPYSRINYPAFESEWIPPVQQEVSGVIASTNNHAATHPRQEIAVRDGRIAEIKGGGLYGELFRLLYDYPGMHDLTWPFFQKPGYWWLFEAGLGTNPKYFKHPAEILRGGNGSERNVGGTIHWAFGTEAQTGPNKAGERAPETLEFARQYNVPPGHVMHNHNLLPTYQVRIRGTGQWETLINYGRMSALDDPEVRALASRYGNADELLRQDYVPALPGITMPGNYDEYARDPGTYWTRWAQSVEDGSYRYFKP